MDYAPVYDYNYYVGKYADIWNAFGMDDEAVLKHFLNYGMKREERVQTHSMSFRIRMHMWILDQAFGSKYT